MPRAKSKRPVGRPRALSSAQVAEVVAWADANVGPKGKPIVEIARAIAAATDVSESTVRNVVKKRWLETREAFTGVLCFPDPESVRKLFAFIASARRTIHVYVYKFTSMRLVDALAAARRRGVRVYVVVDGKATPAATLFALERAHIKVKISSCNCAHPKVLVVDKVAGLQGSMDWTEAGLTSNAEILSFVTREDAASMYKFVQAELARKRESESEVERARESGRESECSGEDSS